MAARGERDTAKYAKLSGEVLARREAAKKRFIERANELLERVIPEAEHLGLKLGIENREALEELPIESDYGVLFKELDSPAVVYWHDTGHAQIKENLGFLHHAFHLESLRDKLFGFHIHDVQFPGRDHAEPGTGTVDFRALKATVKPGHVKVFEFAP